MPFAEAHGARLYFEDTGRGTPIVFVHEFAGDLRSWEPQVRALARQHRCVTFNARGYPPSDVPNDPGAYSQMVAADDIAAVLHAANLGAAHLVGCSMGSFAALHLALRQPQAVRSLVLVGCGYGERADQREAWRADARRLAALFESAGSKIAADEYKVGPYRLQLQAKDPRGWSEFASRLADHSAAGAALTLRGVQEARPPLADFHSRLERMELPVLLIVGDEDEPCLEVNLWLKRTLPRSGLAILPRTGHTVNLEEPDSFNSLLQGFVAAVEAGHWEPRDPRTKGDSSVFQQDE
jgi:pimeloyl-ACP methyl ester carboxylesterase